MANDNNNGPVTRLVRLPQGHYRRVGNDEAPEFLKEIKLNEQIFEDIRFCFDNTCFVTDEEYAKLHANSVMYTDECSETLQVTEADEAQVFYKAYTRHGLYTVTDIAVQTSRQVDTTVERGVGPSKVFDDVECKQETGEQAEQEVVDSTEQQQNVTDADITHAEIPEDERAALADRLAKFGGPLELDINSPDVFKGKGVPALFYTKSRVNPTMVIMTIDYEMQVIYMTRSNINRFFPVKLISRLVTNPEIIHEEFTKQVEADPQINLTYMVLINAANFTDSVAIQFPDPILKDKFVEDLKHLKNEIRTQSA